LFQKRVLLNSHKGNNCYEKMSDLFSTSSWFVCFFG
jgi:hypothetical protein